MLNGRGVLHQALARVPSFCQHQPTYRPISPRLAPAQRHDDALGRALEPLDDEGGTARYRLSAATAAKRLGRSPTETPRDSPRGSWRWAL